MHWIDVVLLVSVGAAAYIYRDKLERIHQWAIVTGTLLYLYFRMPRDNDSVSDYLETQHEHDVGEIEELEDQNQEIEETSYDEDPDPDRPDPDLVSDINDILR